MDSLNRQIHFLSSMKRKIGVGLILSIYLNFIIIVLEPFDTSQFEAEYKTFLLSGYGILASLVFVIHGSIENSCYVKMGKVWLVWYEMITVITFCFFAGTVLYLYNVYIVNEGKTVSRGGYLTFLFITTAQDRAFRFHENSRPVHHRQNRSDNVLTKARCKNESSPLNLEYLKFETTRRYDSCINLKRAASM